jgi:hypothetical protein
MARLQREFLYPLGREVTVNRAKAKRSVGNM